MTRLLIVSRNHVMPFDAARMCGAHLHRTSRVSPGSLRAAAASPTSSPFSGLAAPRFSPRLTPPQARNLAGSAEPAPSFDATAGQWIVKPSRMTRDAGASADPGHPTPTREEFTHNPARFRKSSSASVPASPPGAGTLLEAFTVALGLTVFGLIAGFFLVLA